MRLWRDGEAPQGVHSSIDDNKEGGNVKTLGDNTYRLEADITNTEAVGSRRGEYNWTVLLVQIEPKYKELGIQAKGQIILMEAGVKLPTDELLQSKLVELKYLEKSIGQIGLLAIMPFLKTTSQDIWQVYYLQDK